MGCSEPGRPIIPWRATVLPQRQIEGFRRHNTHSLMECNHRSSPSASASERPKCIDPPRSKIVDGSRNELRPSLEGRHWITSKWLSLKSCQMTFVVLVPKSIPTTRVRSCRFIGRGDGSALTWAAGAPVGIVGSLRASVSAEGDVAAGGRSSHRRRNERSRFSIPERNITMTFIGVYAPQTCKTPAAMRACSAVTDRSCSISTSRFACSAFRFRIPPSSIRK